MTLLYAGGGGEWIEARVGMQSTEPTKHVANYDPREVQRNHLNGGRCTQNKAQEHCVDVVHQNLRIFHYCWLKDSTDSGLCSTSNQKNHAGCVSTRIHVVMYVIRWHQ